MRSVNSVRPLQGQIQFRERFQRFAHDRRRGPDVALAEPAGRADFLPVPAPCFLRQPGVAKSLLAEAQVAPSSPIVARRFLASTARSSAALAGRQHRGDVVHLGEIDTRRTHRLGNPLPRTVRFDLRFTTFAFGGQEFSVGLYCPVTLSYPQTLTRQGRCSFRDRVRSREGPSRSLRPIPGVSRRLACNSRPVCSRAARASARSSRALFNSATRAI